MNFPQIIQSLIFLLIATSLEVSGDAIVRKAIYEQAGAFRIAFLLLGGVLLLGYGSFLNLAPVPFGRVVGLYIAVLFVVWQVVSFVAFRTLPSMQVLVGGVLVIAGGLVITFWRPAGS
jgi:small multidrug resistance family-3 protein